MVAVTKTANKILKILTDGLNDETRSRKIMNSTSFMPVSVEYLYSTHEGDFFSVAHYYEQNGDLMRDPEIVFLRKENKIEKGCLSFYPTSFIQDNIGVYKEFLKYDDNNKIIAFNAKSQSSCSSFCTLWMKNIKEQQGI